MSDFVRSLVTAKAEVAGVEGKSDLPIHAAARNGHTAVVKVLLVNGANVNAANARGQTPLHLAFRFGHKGTLRLRLTVVEPSSHIERAGCVHGIVGWLQLLPTCSWTTALVRTRQTLEVSCVQPPGPAVRSPQPSGRMPA